MTVPCYDPALGWLDTQNGFYYKAEEPQPATFEGHDIAGGDGVVYVANCFQADISTVDMRNQLEWRKNPPPGSPPSVAQVAQEAVAEMKLSGPAISATPQPTGTPTAKGQAGLVGVPVWLWTPVTATTWGPDTITAAVPGVAVTATAHATKIVWHMGDGHNVTCKTAGTPYTASRGVTASPTCGYTYSQPSTKKSHGVYTVTATTYWHITWRQTIGGNQTGTIDVTMSSTAYLKIDEVQVVAQ